MRDNVNSDYRLIASQYSKPFSMTAKSAGLEIIRILDAIPETEQIDALAIAVKVFTEDSETIQNLRKAVREMNG